MGQEKRYEVVFHSLMDLILESKSVLRLNSFSHFPWQLSVHLQSLQLLVSQSLMMAGLVETQRGGE